MTEGEEHCDFPPRILDDAVIGQFKGYSKMNSYRSVSDVAVSIDLAVAR